jgi:hypothetical protein
MPVSGPRSQRCCVGDETLSWDAGERSRRRRHGWSKRKEERGRERRGGSINIEREREKERGEREIIQVIFIISSSRVKARRRLLTAIM